MDFTNAVFWKSEAVREFYANMLQGYDIKAKPENIVVTPYARNGDFDVATNNNTVDEYFDIGNVALGNLAAAGIAAYLGRSVYHGRLRMTSYFATHPGGGVTANTSERIVTGPPSGLTNWVFKARNGVAGGESNINAPIITGVNDATLGFIDEFPDLCFTFLRKMITSAPAGACVHRTEYIFNGFKIDY